MESIKKHKIIYSSRIRRIASAVEGINHGDNLYEGWNFNSGNYLFTTDTK